jgi:hypothetical protein
MHPERRGETRWPTAAHVHLTFENGAQAESRVLNVNLGGCFLEGSFGLRGGEVIYVQSQHNPMLNGLYVQVQWVVDEPHLRGVGVRFQPMDDQQKFEIIKWFNKLVPEQRL